MTEAEALREIALTEEKVAAVCDNGNKPYIEDGPQGERGMPGVNGIPFLVELDAKYLNPLLVDMEKTFADCLATATRKNHDYGGSNNDPFANFRNSTIAGVSVERGILVRLMDKMSRISTLLDKEAQVKDEAVDDTIDDAINYLAILKSYRKQNK